MEDKEIDDFERLYALTLARENNLAKEEEFKEEDICNLAKFKEIHPELFNNENRMIIADDMNYYVIPKKVNQTVRNGNEEIINEIEAYIIIDSSGKSIGLILDNGTVIKDFEKEEKEEEQNQEQELEQELEQEDSQNDNKQEDPQKEDDIDEAKNVNDILERKNKNNKNRVYEEAEEIGIEPEVLNQIMEKRNCNANQINMREIKNMEKVQKDTGIELNSAYENRLVAIRINYGSEFKYYLIDKETGRFLNPNSIDGRGENIPEVQDYFKYRFKPGVEESLPLRKDENFTYITYLNESNTLQQIAFLNNGKPEDMIQKERELYTDEVARVNLSLQQAIDEYQQVATQENWLRVKDVMQKRVEIDQKYRVLENQRKLTGKTLEEAKETVDVSNLNNGENRNVEKEEEDDPRIRGGRY